MPSLAIVLEGEDAGHPLEPRLRALRDAGWQVDAGDSLPQAPCDVVHLVGAPAPGAIAAAKETGARVVVGLDPDDALERPDAFEPVRQHADLIHVESAALRRLGGEAAVVVPPVAAAYEAGRSTGPLRVLSSGPLTWGGGYEYALHGVRLALDRGLACEYRLVDARGPFLDAVEFARHQLGLDLLELGGAPGGDVLLAAPVAPRSPRPVLDAMASGLAVISSEELGPALVVPKRDPVAIADALIRLAEDRGLRDSVGTEGRRFAAAFGVDAQVRAYLDLYTAAASVTSAAS